MRKFLLNNKLVWGIALWSIAISIPPSNAFAMPSSSVTTFSTPSAREMQMNRILTELSRPESRAHMMMMGMSQQDLKEQLSQLDDAQLASVAQKAESVKIAGGIGILVTILVIGILAIIFYRLANNKKIIA